MPRNREEIVDLSLEFYGETPERPGSGGAYLVSEDGGDTKVWLPKSQTQVQNQNYAASGTIEVSIPCWLAQEKKFAGF